MADYWTYTYYCPALNLAEAGSGNELQSQGEFTRRVQVCVRDKASASNQDALVCKKFLGQR